MQQRETESPAAVPRLVAPTPATQEPRARSARLGTLSGIAALPATPMMRAEIARRAVQGRGNAELQRMLRIRPQPSSMLLRSPLSQELEALWNAQAKDRFFDRMRALKERDTDLEVFITTRLVGDDKRLALNLLYDVPEGSWPSGTLSITQTLNSAPAAGGKYSSHVEITFVPDARVRAKEIGFIQSTRWTRTGTGTTESVDPREGIAPRLTQDAWAIDRLPWKTQGWYGFVTNTTAGGTVTLGSAPPPVNATMTDEPFWNQPNIRIEFETAAVGRAGRDEGKVYKVITWGFEVDASNRLTALPHAEADHESPAFQAAVAAWNAQAAGPIGRRNHPVQKQLGPLY